MAQIFVAFSEKLNFFCACASKRDVLDLATLRYMKNKHRAQCTEEAEREVGGGCTNIMMTEKL